MRQQIHKNTTQNELTPTIASTTAWYPLRKRVASISNSWFSWINFSIRWASSSARSLGTDAPRLLHNWMTEVGMFHRVHQSSKLSLHDDVLDDAREAIFRLRWRLGRARACSPPLPPNCVALLLLLVLLLIEMLSRGLSFSSSSSLLLSSAARRGSTSLSGQNAWQNAIVFWKRIINSDRKLRKVFSKRKLLV